MVNIDVTGELIKQKKEYKRSGQDRRTGLDRRVAYDLDYFENGGDENRKNKEDRRIFGERREGWVRVTEWSSVCIDVLKK